VNYPKCAQNLNQSPPTKLALPTNNAGVVSIAFPPLFVCDNATTTTMPSRKESQPQETVSRKRQRPRHQTDNADDADEPSASTNATATIEYDPDGTLAVARSSSDAPDANLSIKDVQERLLEPLTAEQKALAQHHYDGAQGDLAQERRAALALDDINPQANSKLTPLQKRHLQQRPHKKTNAVLHRLETKRWNAAVQAVQAVSVLQDTQVGLLEAEHDMERTTAVTQRQLKRLYLTNDSNSDAAAPRNIFDVQLPQTAPYLLQYDRSGRYSILAGQRSGHVAIMDNAQQSLVTEFHVKERIRAVTFLHNFSLAAVAQANHVYIYDYTGAEVHCLDQHTDPFQLAFLPYHWLLASIGRAGYLKYQDVSTGTLVSTHRTQLGAATALKVNPANAVLHAGHANGTVTLWSPAQPTYLAKLLCHKGAAITDLAVDLEGKTMVTAGQDHQLRIWDLRMYQQRHAYICRPPNHMPTSLDVSQRGLLAVGHGSHVTVWSADALQRKVAAPYMHHMLGPAGDNVAQGPVSTVRFRPFEDVVGIGHASGISSIVIPGSGEPALDTSEYHTNPAADVKQRREMEVRALLDKLMPEMITLDSNLVGGIEESNAVARLERLQDIQEAANGDDNTKSKKEPGKKRGRSKIQTKLKRRHKNIIDRKVQRIQEAQKHEAIVEELQSGTDGKATMESPTHHRSSNNRTGGEAKETAPTALKRFF
jgi:U3 small nucleolar RNA-associated protein 7